MASELKIEVRNTAAGLHATLAGDITEESNFAAVLDGKPIVVTLDLAGIARINSTGVREWINFVSALQQSGARIILERCSVAVTQQLNMIANFRGGGQVASIYAPYFCGACEAERTRLLSLSGKRPDLAEPYHCPECKSPMDFDDLPDAYLSFMDV